jgi:hypothetical protein
LFLASSAIACACVPNCAGTSTTPPSSVASIEIILSSTNVAVGQSIHAVALVRDSAGNAVRGAPVTWASSNRAVADISSDGMVAGLEAGTTTILATSGATKSSAVVVVTSQSPAPDVGLVDLNCARGVQPPLPNPPLRTLYVDSQSGNDANDGVTSTTPWQTLGKANSSVGAGDLVYLKGTFTGQWIHPAASGTASNKIVFQAWPGQTAVLDGGRDGAAVFLEGLSHVVIDGLELRNAPYGASLQSNAQFNWLRNLYVHDVEQIRVDNASDNRIEDNRIERCGNEASNTGDCIWIVNNANRNVIARNVIRFGGHGLVSIGGDNTGVAPSNDNVVSQNDLANVWANNLSLIGFASGTIVECNRIHDATSTSTINYARAGMNIAATNNVVRFNLIYNNKGDGIQIQGYRYQGLLQSPSGNRIYQNTVWGNGAAGLQISQQEDGNVSGNTIEQNVFWNNRGRPYGQDTFEIWIDLYNATSIWPEGSLNGNVIRNNILGSTVALAGGQWVIIVINPNNRTYSLAMAQTVFPTEIVGNREVDPLLNSNDFTLLAGSPAIDAGVVLFSGQRFSGSAPDLGARERP